jgi:transcriptional regulator with XRE-family HTH domain
MMPRGKRPRARVPTNIDAQIGFRMRSIRMEQDVSQEALGTALGVSFQQVQKYEKGVNRLSVTRAMQVAKALNTTVGALMGDGGEPIADTTFEYQTYKLARSFKRLHDLNPTIAARFRTLIDGVCDDLESNGKRKR